MLNWLGLLAQQERYKDLLCEAEEHRLIRKALREHRSRLETDVLKARQKEADDD